MSVVCNSMESGDPGLHSRRTLFGANPFTKAIFASDPPTPDRQPLKPARFSASLSHGRAPYDVGAWQ